MGLRDNSLLVQLEECDLSPNELVLRFLEEHELQQVSEGFLHREQVTCEIRRTGCMGGQCIGSDLLGDWRGNCYSYACNLILDLIP